MRRPSVHVIVRELHDGPHEDGALDIRLAKTHDRATSAKDRIEASVTISIANARLETAIARAIQRGMRAVSSSPPVPSRVVRVRTRRAAAALGAGALAGSVAVVEVTRANARRLPEIVEAIRAANPRAVQLVWDGREPDRLVAEQPVFTVLERARATPKGPPVVLAKSERTPFSLRLLVSQMEEQRKGELRC